MSWKRAWPGLANVPAWPVRTEWGLSLPGLVQQAGATPETLGWLRSQLCGVSRLMRRQAEPGRPSHGVRGAAAEGSVPRFTLHSNNHGMSALLASLIVQK